MIPRTGKAYLSLGSNLEPQANLRSALAALAARFGEVVASPVYRMPAVGFEGPDFLNAAAIIDSDLDPFALEVVQPVGERERPPACRREVQQPHARRRHRVFR